MPGRNGTGPQGKGPGTGRGRGFGQGKGQGRNKGGAYGPGGVCICPKCKTEVEHQRGTKCTKVKCPNCGHTMIRKELLNNQK